MDDYILIVTVQPAELLQAKIHLKSPSAMGFCPPESYSHGLRSKCADLDEQLPKILQFFKFFQKYC